MLFTLACRLVLLIERRANQTYDTFLRVFLTRHRERRLEGAAFCEGSPKNSYSRKLLTLNIYENFWAWTTRTDSTHLMYFVHSCYDLALRYIR